MANDPVIDRVFEDHNFNILVSVRQLVSVFLEQMDAYPEVDEAADYIRPWLRSIIARKWDLHARAICLGAQNASC